jgi:hypothetical protein
MQRCAFVRAASADPEADYVAGLELWASDALAVLTFEAAADDLFHFGGKRSWNFAAAAFSCDLDTELELFVHALREPERVLSVYRRTLEPSARAVIPAPDRVLTADGAGPWERPRREPILRPVPAAFASGTASSPAASTPSSPRDADTGSALPGKALAALRDAVARGSSGAWSLGSADRDADGVHATLVTPVTSLVLHISSTPPEGPYYRRIGGYAFRYSPGAISPSVQATLDRVISAVAGVT